MPRWPIPCRLVLAVGVLSALGGCAFGPSRTLSIHAPPEVLEGEHTRITVTVSNVLEEAIIPVSMTLYARRSPAEYFAVRHIVGDVNYLRPLHAAEVRHLRTLDRIEVFHIRGQEGWRRIPHTRFLHPHILLPGHTFTQDFTFQAYASYRHLLHVDFFFLRLSDDALGEHLYVTRQAVPPPAAQDRYTQVFHRVAPDALAELPTDTHQYLLHRPHRPDAQAPSLVTKAVRLPVKRRPFSYKDAARRARYGARTHCYFSAAGAWVFDYETGTWFVAPTGTTKLNGHYTDLVAELERSGTVSLALAAPRAPGDPFLAYLQQAGYSDPDALTPTAHAVVPAADLVTVLHHAEQLGYSIEDHTWHVLSPAR